MTLVATPKGSTRHSPGEGDDAKRCTAIANATGERCRRWAIAGGKVCPTHGGRAPQVKRKAAMRVADAEARKALQALDIEPLDDPVTELLKVASETVALKDFLAGRYANMSAAGETEAAEAYSKALDRASKLLVEINKLGLVERQVRIMEAQGAMIAKAFHGMLKDLGVDTSAEETLAVFRRHMMAIDSEVIEVAS